MKQIKSANQLEMKSLARVGTVNNDRATHKLDMVDRKDQLVSTNEISNKHRRKNE
jgi:hypothetical protein